MAKIFISYRREDSEYQADRLHSALSRYFKNGGDDIFIDIDKIPLGTDFVDHLKNTVGQCEALLALIGRNWLDARQARNTKLRRIDDPGDFVRLEIVTALERDIPVIPVLLDGAPVPSERVLPDDLKPLARRHGMELQRASFEDDVARLVKKLPLDVSSSRPEPPTATETAAHTDVDQSRPSGTSSVDPKLGALIGGAAGSLLGASGAIHGARLGAKIAQATSAAQARQPVSERVFRLQLSDVEGWPEPEFVVIPPGSFLMGAPASEEGWWPNELPQHEVRFDYAFALGKYPVTFEEWDAALRAGAELHEPDDWGWGRGKRPVIDVSWQDAQAYLAWLNERLGLSGSNDRYRLPSESEWEYACRAGTRSRYSTGHSISADEANFRGEKKLGPFKFGTYLRRTLPVGFFSPNAFGLYDMHGNVKEWCADVWNESYANAPSDGSAWLTGDSSQRVVRGGSWASSPRWLRSAWRISRDPTERKGDVGFRVARTLSPLSP